MCYFRYTVNFAKKIGIPITFNGLCATFKLTQTDKHSSKFLNLKLAVSGLLIIVMLVQCIFRYKQSLRTLKTVPDGIYFDVLLATSILFILMYCYVFVFSMKLKLPTVIAYINGHVNLDTKGKVKRLRLSQLEKYTMLFCYMLPLYSLVSPFVLVYGIHWHHPCKPSLIGYWLLDECTTVYTEFSTYSFCGAIVGFVIKLAVFAINQWNMSFVLSVPPFVGALVVFGALGFNKYMQQFENFCQNDKTFTKFTTDYFREIQVLAVFMNEIQQWSINSVTAFFVVILHAVCISGLTRLSWNVGNLLSIMFLIFALFAAIMVKIGVFGLYAGVNGSSNKMVKKLQRKNGLFVRERRSDKKLRQKFYLSCNCLKVYFGSMNFADRLTPLQFIDASNTITVNLLLLK